MKVFDLGQDDEYILIVSRGASITLLCLYLLYLWFSLRTHRNLFRYEAPLYWDDGSYVEYGYEHEEPPVKRQTAVVILLCSTLMLIFCVVNLMKSFDAVIQTRNVTPSSLGFIFIPFACSGAKNAIAVDLAIKDDMDGVRLPIPELHWLLRLLTIADCSWL